MKTLALAVLIFGLFAAGGASSDGATEERALSLVQYDGSQPAIAERYGIEVVTRLMPIGESIFECLIKVSPKCAGSVKAPLLKVRDSASGGDYSLSATLAWEPVGEGLQVRIYSGIHRSLRQTVIIPFINMGVPDGAASGIAIDLGSVLKNQK